MRQIPKIVFMASGNGSNFQKLVEFIQAKSLACKIEALICDQANAYVLKRAENLGIQSYLIERKNFDTKNNFEQAILQTLSSLKPDYILLAGYMRLLPSSFIHAYPNKIINIHPSLLPSFKGLEAIKQAYEYGVEFTGCTVHLVDESLDGGIILGQKCITISPNDTLENVEEKIHQAEHLLYPEIFEKLITQKLELKGRKAFFYTY